MLFAMTFKKCRILHHSMEAILCRGIFKQLPITLSVQYYLKANFLYSRCIYVKDKQTLSCAHVTVYYGNMFTV